MSKTTWLRALTVGAAVCALVTVLTWAQPDDATKELLAADGWQQVSTNVFERHLSNGTVETLSWGLEGVAWELEKVRDRINNLESLRQVLEGPQPQLLESLAYHRTLARDLEAQLAGEDKDFAPIQPDGEHIRSLIGALGCNLNITRNASAFPTSTGPSANATASFSDTCSTQGQVYSRAYAEGIYNGAFRSNLERDPASGWRFGVGSASSSASAAVVATSSCSSDAQAKVTVFDSNGDPAHFNRSATNSTCRTGGGSGSTDGPGGDGPLPK